MKKTHKGYTITMEKRDGDLYFWEVKDKSGRFVADGSTPIPEHAAELSMLCVDAIASKNVAKEGA